MKMPVAAMVAALSGGVALADDAETYAQMRAPERRVALSGLDGSPVLGASLSEKSDPRAICLKRVDARPGALPNFKCYRLARPPSAKEDYEKLPERELAVEFFAADGEKAKRFIFQKGDDGNLCRRAAARASGPFTYTCYTRRISLQL